MAVPKKKTTPSRRNMRRAHDAIEATASVNTCATTGEVKMMHHAHTDNEGNVHYRGRVIKAAKSNNSTADVTA